MRTYGTMSSLPESFRLKLKSGYPNFNRADILIFLSDLFQILLFNLNISENQNFCSFMIFWFRI